MSVIRVNKTKDYSVISNYHLRDKNLSLKAKGLLSMMLSLPDDWEYSVEKIVWMCKENETAVKTALDELKEFDYLEVIKKYPNETKSGRFEYEYIVYETPKQKAEKQAVEKQDLEILPLENPTLLNTNKINTNIYNNKEEEKKILKEKQFDIFWNEYPKKINKQGVYKAFMNIKDLDKIFDKIIQDVKLKKTQWKEYQYIPYPLTYIHQRRWEEETETKQDLWWNGYDFNAELKKSQDNLEKLENKLKNS